MDRRTGGGSSGVGTLYSHWKADIATATDYYPFGMMMPGRYKMMNGDTAVYRFGFNGQEKVNEIAGMGNHNTALFWEYDTRLGRRWNLDPVDQIGISNYAAFANNPIWFNDPLGNTARIYNKYSDKGNNQGTEKSSARKEVGGYTVKTVFGNDKEGNESIVGYRAYRDGRAEWELDAGDLEDFTKNVGNYTETADAFFAGSEGQQKMGIGLANGDWTLVREGIMQENKEAWTNPVMYQKCVFGKLIR